MKPTEACEHEARETALTLINNQAFYDLARPTIDTLAAKLAVVKFDATKAPAAFVNLINTGIRSHEWATVYGTWRPSVASRKLAAVEILDHYRDQICEKAAELIGPEYMAVDVCEWAHDMSGNPTARHHVCTSTEDGGCVRLLTPRKVRRDQVGYGDRLDGCPGALRKAGFRPEWYELTGTTGDRSADSIIANYRRRPVTF
jgi:hypothetical protein